MNRFILSVFLAVLASGVTVAQDYSLCSQVIGSAGRSVVLQNQRWSYTVGEAVIFTLNDTLLQRSLTQGFHQPEWCSTVSTGSPELEAWSLLVFPNPVSELLTIDYTPPHEGNLHLRIFNSYGQLQVQLALPAAQGRVQVDCRHWQAGLYFLEFRDERTRARGSYRLVRL